MPQMPAGRAAAGPDLSTSTTAWLAPAVTAAGALGCCAVAGLAGPARDTVPLCPFKALTGWACPVCGSTRMLHALLHLDIGAAAHYNVVVLVLLPALGYGWLAWTAGRLGRRLPTWRPSPRALRIGLGLWLAFSVVRDLPWVPALHV